MSLSPLASSSRRKSSKPCVNAIMMSKRDPAVTVDDLALMLEIDLSLGCKADFRERLQKALDAVAKSAGTA